MIIADVGPVLPALTLARETLDAFEVAYLICLQDNDIAIVLPAAASRQAATVHRAISTQLQRRIRAGLSAPADIPDIRLSVSQARVLPRTARDHLIACSRSPK
jgi:hypothetical protein